MHFANENKYRMDYVCCIPGGGIENSGIVLFNGIFLSKGNFQLFNQPYVERLSFGSKI